MLRRPMRTVFPVSFFLLVFFLCSSCDVKRDKSDVQKEPVSQTGQLDVTVTSSIQLHHAVAALALAPDRYLPGRGHLILALKTGGLVAYGLSGKARRGSSSSSSGDFENDTPFMTPSLTHLVAVPDFVFKGESVTLILGFESLERGRARLLAYGYHDKKHFFKIPLETTSMKSVPRAFCLRGWEDQQGLFTLSWQGRAGLGVLDASKAEETGGLSFILQAQRLPEERKEGECPVTITFKGQIFTLTPDQASLLVLRDNKPFAVLHFQQGLDSQGLENADAFALSSDNFGGGFPEGVLAVYDNTTHRIGLIARDYLQGILVKKSMAEHQRTPSKIVEN